MAQVCALINHFAVRRLNVAVNRIQHPLNRIFIKNNIQHYKNYINKLQINANPDLQQHICQ